MPYWFTMVSIVGMVMASGLLPASQAPLCPGPGEAREATGHSGDNHIHQVCTVQTEGPHHEL